MAAPRRSGRRPGSSGTRDAILAAARRQFAEQGYDRTSMRGIAAEAAVDQALVAHFFGGKQALFVEVVRLPFEPSQVLPLLLEGDRETVSERLARFVASILESPEGQIVGMVMARHVIEVEPLAALSADELADLLAPTLQRYLVGELRRS
jgi:AcrR family transcriptional regulator